MNIQSVLVIDDEPLMRDFVGETLERMGCFVSYASDGKEAFKKISNNLYDIVFTDLKLPKHSGLEILKKIKSYSIDTEVVMMTAYGTIETAIEAMKNGASDYLLKPFNPDQIEIIVKKISNTLSLKAQNAYLKREIEQSYGFGELIGTTKLMKNIYNVIKKVAPSNASILISGQSGTGKELVARAIHYNSDRKDKPFIKLNCAALPSNLIESELFGHEKGAFTGALSQRLGRFELANEGTIFLDEISELNISLQSKLLRVLQEKEFDRVGSAKTVKVNVRVLASTNRDLKEEIKNGNFREDLFYRLNVVPISICPLKERKNDIKLLCNHFLDKYVKENKKQPKKFSDNSLKILTDYSWPGNVRELENVIERSVVMDRSDIIEPEDLGIISEDLSYNNATQSGYEVGKSLAEIEKKFIFDTLKECNDNRTKAASMLKISIRTLRNKLNEYKKDK